MLKTTHQLKAGDVVLAHGGKFRVTEDAKESRTHFDDFGAKVPKAGPSDTAWAPAVCIDGSCGAYFYPGSNWTFQGNFYAPRLTVQA
jgi:hypothetical protein